MDCRKEHKPIRLMKSETGLPVNILDVQYYVTAEFGLMQYIEIQRDTNIELNEEHSEWIFFSEEAEVLSVDIFGRPSVLSGDVLNVMKEYVKKSYHDNNSLLSKYFEQRRREWER
jgi:hypothetical protein